LLPPLLVLSCALIFLGKLSRPVSVAVGVPRKGKTSLIILLHDSPGGELLLIKILTPHLHVLALFAFVVVRAGLTLSI
jgi:hypothetical protein